MAYPRNARICTDELIFFGIANHSRVNSTLNEIGVNCKVGSNFYTNDIGRAPLNAIEAIIGTTRAMRTCSRPHFDTRIRQIDRARTIRTSSREKQCFL